MDLCRTGWTCRIIVLMGESLGQWDNIGLEFGNTHGTPQDGSILLPHAYRKDMGVPWTVLATSHYP